MINTIKLRIIPVCVPVIMEFSVLNLLGTNVHIQSGSSFTSFCFYGLSFFTEWTLKVAASSLIRNKLLPKILICLHSGVLKQHTVRRNNILPDQKVHRQDRGTLGQIQQKDRGG